MRLNMGKIKLESDLLSPKQFRCYGQKTEIFQFLEANNSRKEVKKKKFEIKKKRFCIPICTYTQEKYNCNRNCSDSNRFLVRVEDKIIVLKEIIFF